MGIIVAILLAVLALIGMPLFAVMGGSSEALWLTHDQETLRHLRFIAPNVLDDRFAGSPILVTIPLFTFVGYLMAESKTPDRIVRASSAFFGWMPGGLAIVCIVASAFFTTLTGGSGVTIVAIGGLLYPALRKQGYPHEYALGLVTTGGSLGLLLPPSLPILVYALVAGIDFNVAFKAAAGPGIMIMVMLAIHAVYTGRKYNVPRAKPNFREMLDAIWLLKWELGVPLVILGGLGTGLTSIDESAALTAVYTLCIEVFVYKDLDLKKDVPRVAKASMGLAGAIILILSMANALINFVIDQRVPSRVLDAMLGLGLTETWQFLIVLNIFLLVLGMLMEGFSAILVAVPLILPFAARFNLQPFHLAVMFLLNLEIAYCAPPLGLNLFIASFRFEKPLVSLYRIVLPFTGILVVGLLIVMYIPKVSTIAVDGDIAKAYALAEKNKEAPREAWLLQCVQEDRSNPIPCTDADKKKWGADGSLNPYDPTGGSKDVVVQKDEPGMGPGDTSGSTGGDTDDDLFKQMMGAGSTGSGGTTSGDPNAGAPKDDMDDLFKQMMGAGSTGSTGSGSTGSGDTGSAPPATTSTTP
ncbi:MAG: TRAP transporter large permease [Polyangiaceae bacterium]|nr:TRAP transporter large permease [Polyangiaceae bacterium]